MVGRLLFEVSLNLVAALFCSAVYATLFMVVASVVREMRNEHE